MKKNKALTIFLALFLCVGAVYGARIFFGPRGKVTSDKRTLNRSIGDPNAPVWIVEYMDYQCPACRRGFFILEAYFKEYPSKIHLQARFHPIQQHAHGLRSAVYAECATKQKKFWELHRKFFENQDSWKDLPEVESIFHAYAQSEGLDLGALDACISDPLTVETVFKEKSDSIDLGVRITPTFFINGKMVAGIDELKNELKVLFPEFVLTPEKEGERSY